MKEQYGMIWIDRDEVILRIYEKLSDSWKLFHYSDYDLATFVHGKLVCSSEIIDVIATILVSSYATHVGDWHIYARGIEEDTLLEVSSSTSIKSELLTLQREQDLLCKGVLTEIQDF